MIQSTLKLHISKGFSEILFNSKRMKEDFLGVFKKELVELGEVKSQRPPGATAVWRSGPSRLWTSVPQL